MNCGLWTVEYGLVALIKGAPWRRATSNDKHQSTSNEMATKRRGDNMDSIGAKVRRFQAAGTCSMCSERGCRIINSPTKPRFVVKDNAITVKRTCHACLECQGYGGDILCATTRCDYCDTIALRSDFQDPAHRDLLDAYIMKTYNYNREHNKHTEHSICRQCASVYKYTTCDSCSVILESPWLDIKVPGVERAVTICYKCEKDLIAVAKDGYNYVRAYIREGNFDEIRYPHADIEKLLHECDEYDTKGKNPTADHAERCINCDYDEDHEKCDPTGRRLDSVHTILAPSPIENPQLVQLAEGMKGAYCNEFLSLARYVSISQSLRCEPRKFGRTITSHACYRPHVEKCKLCTIIDIGALYRLSQREHSEELRLYPYSDYVKAATRHMLGETMRKITKGSPMQGVPRHQNK
jgi:hypothetical protein